MGDLFYTIGVFIAILNAFAFLNYKKIFNITEWLFQFKKIALKNPTSEDFRRKSDHQLLLFWAFTITSTVTWMIFGLLSNEWIVFLLLFLSNILINYTKKLFSSISLIKLFLSFMKSLIGFCVICFLVINYFHLGIDIMNEIEKLCGHH